MTGLLHLILPCLLLCVVAEYDEIAESESYTVNDITGNYVQESGEDNYNYRGRFSQCEFMKKLFGVSYDQMQGDKLPKLNNLSLVYKTKNATKIFNINTAAEALFKEREFDEDKRLIIFVHGYTDNPTKKVFTIMSQVFLANGHINLIALDASSALSWMYMHSTAYVRFIGQKLGQFLATIVRGGQDPADIHIIGHSLGAHISGFAGKAFRELTGQLLGRISGLDPAGPCFNAVHPDTRLKDTDAAVVSVIHTDSTKFGIDEPVGHKDFYPNAGWLQPNCFVPGCSHMRSWILFAESVVNPLAFPALRCKDWESFKRGDCDSEISYMGYSTEDTASKGQYFLQTAGKFPYGLGLIGTKYQKTSLFW